LPKRLFEHPLKQGLISALLWLLAIMLLAAAQAGDLILRRGTEMISNAVMAVDDGNFSHVGMLMGEPGRW